MVAGVACMVSVVFRVWIGSGILVGSTGGFGFPGVFVLWVVWYRLWVVCGFNCLLVSGCLWVGLYNIWFCDFWL